MHRDFNANININVAKFANNRQEIDTNRKDRKTRVFLVAKNSHHQSRMHPTCLYTVLPCNRKRAVYAVPYVCAVTILFVDAYERAMKYNNLQWTVLLYARPPTTDACAPVFLLFVSPYVHRHFPIIFSPVHASTVFTLSRIRVPRVLCTLAQDTVAVPRAELLCSRLIRRRTVWMWFMQRGERGHYTPTSGTALTWP